MHELGDRPKYARQLNPFGWFWIETSKYLAAEFFGGIAVACTDVVDTAFMFKLTGA